MSPDPDLAELRRQLPAFGFNEYLRHLKAAEAAAASARPIRVAIVRSYTVEPIEPLLKLQFLLDGWRPSLWIGGYDQYAQEMLDTGGGLYRFAPDLVVVMVRIEEMLPEFVDEFPSFEPAFWRGRLAAKAREVAQLAERASADLSAQVIVQNAVLQRPYFGIFDAQRRDGQDHLVRLFNETLSESVEGIRGVWVWDFERHVRAVGLDQLYDAKAWYVSRNPYRQSAYPAIARDLYRYVASALGRIKKCVVLDLDNTLWGGVVGEDGFDGLALGHTYPGNCFRDFQKELLRLYHRGILLAINSKNNPDEALRVIDEHPDMILRREHFAAMRINWVDKASNLRSIAQELNIGVDSMVFADDNPAECALVQQECPGCDVVLLPQKPYLLPAAAAAFPGVENIRVTDEDRRKGDLYRADAARRQEEDRFSNLDDFLQSLDLQVAIEPAASFSIPRIAQLTQKTNQWNMTTRRYTDAQIHAFAGDPSMGVFAVSARDRFGDHGIIGALILRFDRTACVIDTFLLSCRVIGRGIEQAVIAFAAEAARARGIDRLVGEFVRTQKNAPAEGFYETIGFKGADGHRFVLMLTRDSLPYPRHIRIPAPAENAEGR